MWKDRFLERSEEILIKAGYSEFGYYNYLKDIHNDTMKSIFHITCKYFENICFITKFKRVGYLMMSIYLNNKLEKLRKNICVK